MNQARPSPEGKIRAVLCNKVLFRCEYNIALKLLCSHQKAILPYYRSYIDLSF